MTTYATMPVDACDVGSDTTRDLDDEWRHEFPPGALGNEPHDLRMAVAINDVVNLDKKDDFYGSSWKKRGGIGAFMMLARKWDRLENILKESREIPGMATQASTTSSSLSI